MNEQDQINQTPSLEDTPVNLDGNTLVDSGNVGSGSVDGFSWMPVIGTMVVFFLVLIVAVYIIRYFNKKGFRSMNASWVRVLDRQPLGTQQSLYLVEIAGQLQILGVTDHQIIKIADVNDPEIVAEILEDIANRPTEKTTEILSNLGPKNFLQRRKKRESFSQELKRLLEEVEE